MKPVLVVAFLALLGLASAQQFFSSSAITRISPSKNDYFFCVPLGVVPTGEYNLAIQYVLEKPASILVKFQDSKLNSDLSLPESLPIHTSELKSKGSMLPLFNEEKFLLNGCVSGIVQSNEALVKVIVAFMPKDIKEVREVPESSQTCAKFLADATRVETEEEEKPKHHRVVPFFAIFSLSAGVVLLVCSLLSCCCLCCRRRCQQERCCRSQTVCASEAKDGTEMNIVTEQVAAVQDTQAPVAAFYYVPAGAHGAQYTPMQFVAPSATAYPGNAQYFVAAK